MIRILHVLGGLDRGGAEALVMNLYRNIDREEIQFDFVIHTTEHQAYYDEIVSMGGKIFHCPRYKGKNHFEYKKWWRNFFEENPQYRIIHSHIRSCASVFLPIAKKYGLKTIIHSHNTSNGKGIASICKRLFQYPLRYQADYFFGCSVASGEWLFGKKVANGNKFYVLKNAIDTNCYKFNTEIREQYRERLNLSDKIVYIHVGRFHPQKNHVFLLEVFSEIKKLQKDAILLLVGDGELRVDIEQKIKELNLETSVQLLGSRSDVACLLQASDCFLFPSLYEGLPVTVVEAQTSGIRCLLSNTITKEIHITNVLKYLPIDEGYDIWVTEALDDSFVRKDVSADVCKAGFDIIETVKNLVAFYKKIIYEI